MMEPGKKINIDYMGENVSSVYGYGGSSGGKDFTLRTFSLLKHKHIIEIEEPGRKINN